MTLPVSESVIADYILGEQKMKNIHSDIANEKFAVIFDLRSSYMKALRLSLYYIRP